ncbi:hypothetical protein ACTS9C_12010 [Empedobacter brevis]
MKGLIFVLMTFTQAVFAQNLWKVEYETYDKIFLDEKDANFKAELDKIIQHQNITLYFLMKISLISAKLNE